MWKEEQAGPDCLLGGGGPPGVGLVESHMFILVSRDVFGQLVGSSHGLKPARQPSGAARSREHCGG